MAEYCISCCSTADLTKEYFDKRGIRYVCFHYELGGTDYLDDLGQTMPPAELYRRMLAGEDVKTSQVSIGEYADFFRKIFDEGKDILHLTLSSGISGSYNSACIAAEQVREEYPNRKIYVVDSLAASSGYGLLVDTLADRRDAGESIDELYAWVCENKKKLQHWFFTSDLTFFIRGGRVSKAAGFFGGMLGICPLLNVDYEGHLTAREKVRTKKKVIQRIVQKMEENAEGGLAYSGKCYICQSECMDDAKAVAMLVESRFLNLNGKVEIYPIGATIGSHTGPGTVALFFWGKERVD
ncbi:DegV family protein [Anthropogastromicrobium sp.]|jgi:DegV family protein with EDD domain|uniref:DegV family protein n=1 Tax=Anthropogastromicrobium sp. TaxID=2981649 RepID=UPI00307C4D3F